MENPFSQMTPAPVVRRGRARGDARPCASALREICPAGGQMRDTACLPENGGATRL